MAISRALTRTRNNIADIRAVSKNFGLMREEQKTEISAKTKCRKNDPMISNSCRYFRKKTTTRRDAGPRISRVGKNGISDYFNLKWILIFNKISSCFQPPYYKIANEPCYEYAEGLYREPEPNLGLRYSPPLQIVPFLLFVFRPNSPDLFSNGRACENTSSDQICVLGRRIPRVDKIGGANRPASWTHPPRRRFAAKTAIPVALALIRLGTFGNLCEILSHSWSPAISSAPSISVFGTCPPGWAATAEKSSKIVLLSLAASTETKQKRRG